MLLDVVHYMIITREKYLTAKGDIAKLDLVMEKSKCQGPKAAQKLTLADNGSSHESSSEESLSDPDVENDSKSDYPRPTASIGLSLARKPVTGDMQKVIKAI